MARTSENAKAVSDVEIIAALMANSTIAKAAEAAGISRRALYDRTNPAVRLQAAQTILNNATKFAERLSAEDKKAEDTRKNPLDIFNM